MQAYEQINAPPYSTARRTYFILCIQNCQSSKLQSVTQPHGESRRHHIQFFYLTWQTSCHALSQPSILQEMQ